MASKPGRRVVSWRTPAGHRMKCILGHLHRSGLRGKALVAAFKALVPDYQSHFPAPVTDHAIAQRADKGARPGYESEHPDKHPTSRQFWEWAGTTVRAGHPVDVQAVD